MKQRIPRPLAILFGLIVLALLGLQAGRPAREAAALQAPALGAVQAQTSPNPCATPSPVPGPCHPNNPHTHPAHPHVTGAHTGNGHPGPNGRTAAAHTVAAPNIAAPRPATAGTAHTYYANKLTDACDGAGCIVGVTDCATSTNPDCTLRDAVALADRSATDAQDTINLKAGTYKLAISPNGTLYTAPVGPDPTVGALKLTNSMTLKGAGTGSTFIDGNCQSTCTDRVFEVVNLDMVHPVTLTALTVQNGAPVNNGANISDFPGCSNNSQTQAGGGGGILIDSFSAASNPGTTTTTGPVALNAVTLSGNASTANLFNPTLNTCGLGNGGGVSLWGSSNLSLSNVTLSNNRAATSGGGLSAGGGNRSGHITEPTGVLSISGGSVSGNTACANPSCTTGGGGGIFNGGTNKANSVGTVTLTSNQAFGGGGIVNGDENGGPAVLSLTNDTVAGNTASNTTSSSDSRGGGIANHGSLAMSNVTVSGNSATSAPAVEGGGGIYSEGGAIGGFDSTGTFSAGVPSTNVTISGNTTGGGGGGLHIEGGTANFSGITITGNTAYGGAGIGNEGTLTLNSFVISGNSTVASCSGSCSTNQAGMGGGLGNDGTRLTATNGLINGNSATCNNCPNAQYYGAGGGGGILSFSTLDLTNVTVSDNHSGCTNCYEGGGGAGIANSSTGTFINVTVANNTSSGCLACTQSTSGGFNGGTASGIGNDGTLTATNITISGNSAPVAGGLVNNSSATLKGTVLSNNGSRDCAGDNGTTNAALTSSGYNIASDATCALSGTGDLNSVDPLLQPLANNGGPNIGANGANLLPTMALTPGSPAIDHIPSPSACPPPATDERGVTRPQGAACDSGAFEANAGSSGGGGGGGGIGFGGGGPVPTASPPPSATPTPAPTAAPGTTVTPTPTPTPGCATVTYAAGYNLAGGPTGTVLNGAAGSLFTFQATDTAYRSLLTSTPLTAGIGVWAFFFTPATVTLPCVSKQTQLILLPVSHFIMVSNPGDTAATVSGADVVDTFNPATNSYTVTQGTATLAPGQGAWVFSARGGTLTIANQ